MFQPVPYSDQRSKYSTSRQKSAPGDSHARKRCLRGASQAATVRNSATLRLELRPNFLVSRRVFASRLAPFVRQSLGCPPALHGCRLRNQQGKGGARPSATISSQLYSAVDYNGWRTAIKSFASQCSHRIHGCRTVGGNVAGRDRHRGHYGARSQKCDRIARLQSK